MNPNNISGERLQLEALISSSKSNSKQIILDIYDKAKYFFDTDSAHDFSHVLRVMKNALEIAKDENGDPDVLIIASLLHDICNFPKNHPKRHLSSEYSAKKAEEIINQTNFHKNKIPTIKDAILCHSFSRGLSPKTLDGKIFQDADRLDAIGATGIARTFMLEGKFDAAVYSIEDPFLKDGRELNDKQNSLDHFYTKLFSIKDKILNLMRNNFCNFQ